MYVRGVRPRTLCRMGTVRQSLWEKYLAVERVVGAGLPRTRLQKWAASHPIRFGVYVAVPISLVGLLWTKGPGSGSALVALIFGPVMGSIYSMIIVMDRALRSRLRRRMGLRNED